MHLDLGTRDIKRFTLLLSLPCIVMIRDFVTVNIVSTVTPYKDLLSPMNRSLQSFQYSIFDTINKNVSYDH